MSAPDRANQPSRRPNLNLSKEKTVDKKTFTDALNAMSAYDAFKATGFNSNSANRKKTTDG